MTNGFFAVDIPAKRELKSKSILSPSHIKSFGPQKNKIGLYGSIILFYPKKRNTVKR